jgi:nicotinate phosphoribosyltransferase
MPIVSILDNDLYKFTMQKAVLDCFPGVEVESQFFNRNPAHIFTDEFHDKLWVNLESMSKLRLLSEEYGFMQDRIPFLGEPYLKWLKDYRYDPSCIKTKIIDGKLDLRFKGTWEQKILWEVPLMALISEVYFQCNYKSNESFFLDYLERTRRKGEALSENNVIFTDFGTRRRRSFAIQRMVVECLSQYKGFMGTSNVYLAMKNNVKPLGTMAHEWIMGVSALEGLRHANRYAMMHWSNSYKGNLGTALPDTFGTEAFFEDFDNYYARLFDSGRHDSGCPYIFGDRFIKHYKSININPMHKSLIFSDALNVKKAIDIKTYFQGKINTSFGIGTHFTNDVPDSEALNMVIKMISCNGIPVVKLSDTPSKAIGDKDALRVARWTFFKTPLDI